MDAKTQYENDIHIDPNNLFEECQRQPFIFQRYARKVADADKKRKDLKAVLLITEAELAESLRTEAIGKGEKISEAAIKSKVPTMKAYKKADAEMRKADYEYQILVGVKEAIEHRKYMLKEMTALLIGGFYSTVKITTDDEMKYDRKELEAMEEMQNKALQKEFEDEF